MKRELSGGITSRKNFARKTVFSAKQVSTTLLLLLLGIIIPSTLKANDGRLSDDYYDIYTYNFSDYANNNVQPITGDAYKGAEQTGAVNVRGYVINGQQRDYLAFRFEGSVPSDRRMRWWYENGGLHTAYYGNNANYAGSCPILAVLGFRAGDKIRVFFNGSGSIKYRSPYDNYGNVHMVREWNNDGDFYTKGNNPTILNDVGYIITSDGDLILKADGDVTITSIQIFKVKDADYTLTKGTSQDGNPTYTCTFTGKGRIPSKNMSVPYLLCSFGHLNDYAVIDRSQFDWATGNYCYVFDYNWNQDMRKDDNSVPVGGTYYAFKPTATGYITVDGFLETINWQGSTANFYVFKYNLDNTIAYTDNNFHYAWKDGTPFTFPVEANYIYYLCEDARDNVKGRLHLTSFTFENTSMDVEKLGVVVDLEEGQTGAYITKVNGITSDDDFTASVKRVSSSINPSGLNLSIRENNGEKWFYLSGISFNEHKDKAGTILYDVRAKNNRGEATIAITFPYHADFDDVSADKKDPYRTYGHTWNFIDPRNSDSSIGNSLTGTGAIAGETTGILFIGQAKQDGQEGRPKSQFFEELEKREWIYAQRQTGQAGGYHDPYYMNVFDMVGDNADMIWETEGLWFETDPNYSIIYNENDAKDQSLTNPVDVKALGTDPDRYVGLLPDPDGKSSFTIPGLKNGDRVLIYMKSGEGSGANGIFLNVHGAKDAIGNPISESDLYKAGGTNWQHNRYEGCYHFIKDGDGNMKFDMVGGSMCKLLYIHIYTGQRLQAGNNVVSSATGDDGRLLFMNEKGKMVGAEGDAPELGSNGQGSNMSLRLRGKGQQQKTKVLTCSGNLNYQLSINKNHVNDVIDSHFAVSGDYSQSIDFTSKVGEIGMFRMRLMDVEYGENYVADFCDRNFTVGYRDKVDSYPYTWDFTDIQGFSSSKMDAEADNYPISAASSDEYGDQWDISLFDDSGNMKLNTGFDPLASNHIFDSHKIGFGNQLWAGGDVIPETRGLWFYTDDNDPLYNDCLQITSEGISFCNIPDADGKRNPWWNYKMVVPDVPVNAAVYLRMKRDERVDSTSYKEGNNGNVLFLNTRFAWGTGSKTSLTEPTSTDNKYIYRTQENGTGYSFYKVARTDNEYILAVKNTTGAVNHLQLTLNGWIVEKLAISEDAKTVNRLGWATESRARVIDPALTSELTGYPFETYIVTGASYADKTVTLQPVKVIKQAGDTEKAKVMPAVEVNEDGTIIESTLKNAYIIRNTKLDDERIVNNIPEPGRVQILNNGFHLFVPDMHDYVANRTDNIENQKEENVMTNNMLVSLLTAGTVVNKQGSGNFYNYALTSQKNKVGDDTQTYLEEIGFYRIKDGTTTNGNQAYLPVDCSVTTGTTVTPGAKMSIIFESFDNPGETVETAIEIPFEEVFGDSNAVYYNLNGQKLNGKPTKGGLYIMNGKKILVK